MSSFNWESYGLNGRKGKVLFAFRLSMIPSDAMLCSLWRLLELYMNEQIGNDDEAL